FGVISVPVGMSFYVRNLIRFGTDIFWVYELPADSWQYTGNVPVINRFLWPVPSEMVDNLLNFRIGCGYNVWMQIIRTSVLGEWDMANVGKPVKLIAVLLMLLGAVLAFVAFCSFVKVFIVGGIRQINRKATSGKGADVLPIDAPCYLMFAIGYVVNMFCYLVFAYNYPQQCSMHFRYIEITLLFPAVALGFVLQESKCKWFNRLGILVLVCFAVCSAIMTGVWCML
ncbi:MAG: hypothetical protein IJ512_00615, partial [Ruminococcus sp.]|nr:hypothetical protein [Ruminococcus sp.]